MSQPEWLLSGLPNWSGAAPWEIAAAPNENNEVETTLNHLWFVLRVDSVRNSVIWYYDYFMRSGATVKSVTGKIDVVHDARRRLHWSFRLGRLDYFEISWEATVWRTDEISRTRAK